MKKKGWKLALFFGLALAALGTWASPTPDQIYQAARSGHLSEAQQMVQQVIAEHPNSAKAHYIAAEIYAKEGQMATARTELQTAEQLKPGLPFAKAEAVAKLKAALSAPAPAAPAPAAQIKPAKQHSSSFGTLLMVVLVIGAIIVVIRMMGGRNSTTVYNTGGGYTPPPAAAVPANYPPGGYPPGGYPVGGYPAAGGMGSGILGNVATGAAVGVGIVAGEALAHRLIDDNTAPAAAVSDAVSNVVQPAPIVENADMGGNDFGLIDANSWDDSGNTNANSWDDSSGGGDIFADSSGSDDDWT